MVGSFGMADEIVRPKIDGAEIACRVTLDLILEVAAGRIAALPASVDRIGLHPRAEFDDRDRGAYASSITITFEGIRSGPAASAAACLTLPASWLLC